MFPGFIRLARGVPLGDLCEEAKLHIDREHRGKFGLSKLLGQEEDEGIGSSLDICSSGSSHI
jgi:hypothetical protein